MKLRRPELSRFTPDDFAFAFQHPSWQREIDAALREVEDRVAFMHGLGPDWRTEHYLTEEHSEAAKR